MEDREKIIKFKNINIVDYLNKTHKTADNFLIETQKHNLKKYMKELNTELYKTFVNNSDDLLDILNAYDFCFDLLSDFSAPRINHDDGTNTEITQLNCKEFEKKTARFEDDLTAFKTENRYLVTTEYFNEKKYYVILTNDLMFIGQKIQGEDKKYRLKNVFNRNIVEMKMFDNYIGVTVDGIKYTFTGETDALTDFYDLFTDTTYFMQKEGDEINKDLVKYFIITEQFEKLAEYSEKYPHVEINTESIEPRNEEELKQLLRISRNKNKMFSAFVNRSFESGLSKINKIQVLEKLIEEIFEFFYMFLDDLRLLHSNLDMENWTMNLLIESFIKKIFNTIEKRIFNKFLELKITNENLKLIQSKLVFKEYNYVYMFDQLLRRKEGFSKKCLEMTKNEINVLLDSFMSNS
ncbi:hypothetical protein ECANGB1_42 [Enterospora canceri]|uniref:Uncharacterized protein n=1 Tax=Enterospora canceri TaxID=1081671 RepID=A0A1Y1S8G6_9MICR|nr:hypothetical protein ECANGB1_42 [Enterospora canceri]